MAAREADTALAMFIDELQYVEEEQLAALITALHRVAQRQLPVVLVGAGLPQLRGRTGRAKSTRSASSTSLRSVRSRRRLPSRPSSSRSTPRGRTSPRDAVAAIVEVTQRYPYFLQEWGSHSWDAADASPITAEDVALASATAIAALDASFFGVRFDRLTPSEKRYLRAMAELGPGPHRSGDIARRARVAR